jgi:hypothetical protein
VAPLPVLKPVAPAPSDAASPPRPLADPVALTKYRDSVGKTMSFEVVGSLEGETVLGSTPYTADCRFTIAAVHAGVLKPGESGGRTRHYPSRSGVLRWQHPE